jgi:hypothetical protein
MVVGCGALLAALATVRGAVADTAEERVRAARRVLASGHALPAGFSSLALTTRTVRMDPGGRGAFREYRRPAIAGTFALEGRSIAFETIRGRRNTRRDADENDPRYEIDVCFRDAEGRPFLLQVGGDEVLDPRCDPEHETGPEDGGAGGARGGVERARDFARVAGALATLERLPFRRRFAEEHRALVGHLPLALAVPVMTEPDCAAPGVVCEAAPGAATAVALSHNTRWRHMLEVYAGPIRGIRGATHGATLAYRHDAATGRLERAWHRCNHGRCYYDWTMNRLCGFWSHFDRRYHVHQEACGTTYSPRSGADRWWPGHNSNDDTSIQYRAVRYDQHYPSGWGSGWPCDDTQTHNNTSFCY